MCGLAIAVGVPLLHGCRNDDLLQPMPRAPRGANRASAQRINNSPSGEALFAELAGIAPSSAGFFFDRSGGIFVNLTNESEADLAVQTVRSFIARGDIVVSDGTSPVVLWRLVKYSYADLNRWRNLVFDSAFTSDKRIVSLDLDEAQNRVSVGASESALSAVRGSLLPLLARARADSNAIVVIPGSRVAPASGPPSTNLTWLHLWANADIVVGGLGIGSKTPESPWTCTIGFTADYPSGGGRGLVTASHCTAAVWSVDGRVAHQAWEGPVAGTEVGDPPPWGCGVTGLCRRSDAAFFRKDAARTLERGLIARPTALGSQVVDPSRPYFIVVGSSNGYVGQTVWKVGYASGWTSGSIVATCVDRNLVYVFPHERTVLCTNVSSNSQQGGDSGGPVFLSAGGDLVYLSGTLIGSAPNSDINSSWSTISQMQLDFGFTLGVNRIPTLARPQVSGSMPAGKPVVSWPAVGSATKYNIYKGTLGAFTFAEAVTGTSFSDASVIATKVLPGFPGPGTRYIAYFVTSQSPSDVSVSSDTLYFQRPPLITAVMSGQWNVKPNVGCYWSVAASGGTGSYSYSWTKNGQVVGGNSSRLYATNSGSSFSLAVQVTDGSSQPGSDMKTVTVSTSAPACGV
jgi:hypothetical protein